MCRSYYLKVIGATHYFSFYFMNNCCVYHLWILIYSIHVHNVYGMKMKFKCQRQSTFQELNLLLIFVIFIVNKIALLLLGYKSNTKQSDPLLFNPHCHPMVLGCFQNDRLTHLLYFQSKNEREQCSYRPLLDCCHASSFSLPCFPRFQRLSFLCK